MILRGPVSAMYIAAHLGAAVLGVVAGVGLFSSLA